MIKTPRGGNALLILNVHLEHNTQKFHKKFIRFSLDILQGVPYCELSGIIAPHGKER